MATSASTLLDLKNLSKNFGRMQAVSGASFSVRAGEVVAFLGPNGAGKSTTIRMIMQEIKPSSGEITILGRKATPSDQNHQDIGYLASDMTYEEGLTGQQYLNLVNAIRGGGFEERIKVLEEQLDANLHRRIRTLSRGNKQKIGLIAAVMHAPKLLVMDEPTSGFDPLMQQVFVTIVREHIARGGGALISSHILGEVQHLADRVIFIADGQVLGEQNIRTLLRESPLRIRLHFRSTAVATKARAILQKVGGISLESPSNETIQATYHGTTPALLTTLAKLKPDQCLIQEPELEEIFMQYYNQPTSDEATK